MTTPLIRQFVTQRRYFRRMSFDRFRIGNDWRSWFPWMRDRVFGQPGEIVVDFQPR
jgi:hypothetical protein